MKKSYSECLATAFEFADYFLLIPFLYAGIHTGPLFIYAVFFSFISLFSQHYIFGVVFFVVCFIILAIFIFGILLMIGYFKHSRGKLNRNKTDKLWISTISFNAIFFFPAFYFNLKCLFANECLVPLSGSFNNELPFLADFSILFIVITVWWGAGTFMPFTALLSAKTGKNE